MTKNKAKKNSWFLPKDMPWLPTKDITNVLSLFVLVNKFKLVSYMLIVSTIHLPPI